MTQFSKIKEMLGRELTDEEKAAKIDALRTNSSPESLQEMTEMPLPAGQSTVEESDLAMENRLKDIGSGEIEESYPEDLVMLGSPLIKQGVKAGAKVMIPFLKNEIGAVGRDVAGIGAREATNIAIRKEAEAAGKGLGRIYVPDKPKLTEGVKKSTKSLFEAVQKNLNPEQKNVVLKEFREINSLKEKIPQMSTSERASVRNIVNEKLNSLGKSFGGEESKLFSNIRKTILRTI